MIDPIIYQDQLAKMSGYTRTHDIELWLKKMGIWYATGKDGKLSTTITAFEQVQNKKKKTTVSF